MNARERLNNLITDADRQGWIEGAALRELDSLLKDFADHYSMTECGDNCEHCRELRLKAAQAGYGEK